MLNKINIIKEDNSNLEVSVLSAFKINNNGIEKSYILTTQNELDQNGLTKLLVCEILNDKLVKIVNDEDWLRVKNVMRSIISGSNDSFTYINYIDEYKAEGEFFRVIAVQNSAETQLINDYKQKKPNEVEVKPIVEEEPISPDVTPAIYPKENPEVSIGAEIIPGIIENKPVEDTSVVSDIPVVDFNNPVIDDTTEDNENITNNLSQEEDASTDEPVFNIEMPTTESTIVSDPVTPSTVTTNDPDNNSARETLIKRITDAVDEYLNNITSSNTSNNDEELEKLKSELEDKNKRLNEIMNLLGR